MTMLSLLLCLLTAFLLGMAVTYLFFKSRTVKRTAFDALNQQYQDARTAMRLYEQKWETAETQNQFLTTTLAAKEQEIVYLQSEKVELRTNLQHTANATEQQRLQIETLTAATNTQQQHINQLTTANAELKVRTEALTEKLDYFHQQSGEMQTTARLEFEKMAGQLLEEKSVRFTELNKTNLERLLNPLKEDIEKFKTQVAETYDKESKQRFSLGEKVKDLIEQTNKVSSEANNLATALKGSNQRQGGWGEMILERILEISGLTKNREYFVQQTISNDASATVRPDVLVNLPDNRIVIIDSKVSLNAYDSYASAGSAEEQQTHINNHIKSIRSHIVNLSGKKYDNLPASPDFTMMFVPIEPAYMAAMQQDQGLWNFAYLKRILLVSPTNLIACLKLIDDLWKRERQSRNAQEIARRGGLLYNKLVTFTISLQGIGHLIGKTQDAYNAALKQFNTGKGNLVTQAIQLRELGIKSDKKMPEDMLSFAYQEEDIENALAQAADNNQEEELPF
jgi:DNA recombination protein RmuC